ncbi:MAG: DNA gyrase inhibitor YacG [Planctomycetaceae bacterium]|nr:DNA gyrase inhibitor YacG [Planctomycetaceae bacterium]
MKIESQSYAKFTCPICNRTFDSGFSGVAMPFCSNRCKQIDTRRWLDEEYGLPYESEHDQIETDKKFDTQIICE